MPEYLSPGVYIEEIKIGAAPIEGVSTSTAGMVGVTEKGSVKGLPELVTSFADYERKFGGFLDEGWGDARFLPFAVQGFFQNGGQRAYIKRVVGENAVASFLELKEFIITRMIEDMANKQSDRIKAKLVSMRGISVGTRLKFEETTASGVPVLRTRQVTSYEGNEVSFQETLDHKFTKAGTKVTVEGIGSGLETIKIIAKDQGKWGDNISAQIDSVNNTSAPLAALDVKKTILGAPLEFDGAGPAASANNVTLTPSSFSRVMQNDYVELRNSNGNTERRKITSKTSTIAAPRQIAWSGTGNGPLLNDYNTTGSTINLRDIKFPTLSFDVTGPGSGATEITLTDNSKLQDGDFVEFRNAIGEFERRHIVVGTGNKISWSGTDNGILAHNYSTAGSTITLLSYAIRVENTVGFNKDDRVHIRQGDLYDDAIIESPPDATNNILKLELVESTGLSIPYKIGDMLESITAVRRSGAISVKMASVNNFYVGAVVEFDNGTNKEYRVITGIDKNAKTISWTGALSNMFLDGDMARTCEFNLNLLYTPNKGASIAESHKLLTMNPDTKRYFKTIIENDSKLAIVEDKNLNNPPPGNQPTTDNGSPENLTAGDDGAPPKDKHYIGEDSGPGNRTGIKSLIDIDDISIVAAPGITSQNVQNALIEHCEIVTKDRFAVLDPQKGLDVAGIQAHRNLYDSNYAALYYPWIKAQDPLEDKTILVPPSGHIIGIYSRSDSQRGVHKAPANEVIQGITGVEVQINKGEQDILNPKGINAIRLFPGRGARVWGARTISSDSLWKYINIRRLFLYIEESLDEGTQWVVFEPNNEKLWGRVKATVTEFLTRVWRDGALMGLKAEEAFFVKCDRTTMTQDDIDNGRLIIIIGVAPVKPAEFVIIRIAQWSDGAAPKE